MSPVRSQLQEDPKLKRGRLKSVQCVLQLRMVMRGMRRVGPVELAPERGTHGMAVLLQAIPAHLSNSARSLTTSSKPGSCGRPPTLSAQRHGDFPRGIAGSELPVCAPRSRASAAPLAASNALKTTSTRSSIRADP